MRGVTQRKAFSLWLGLVATVSSGTAVADVDLSGVWLMRLHEDTVEVGPGAGYGNYLGVPVNQDARDRGLSWHPSLHNVPEHQCIPLTPEYGVRWSHQRIWKEIDPSTHEVLAWHIHKVWGAQHRVIWMDDRTRPPAHARHTYQGFSTGEWQKDKLVVTTTHLKEGPIRRNGIYHSDQAKIIEHYIRHGDHLTISKITQDPVYLTEPVIHTSTYLLDLNGQTAPYRCEVVTEIATQSKGYVPHYLPWDNPFVDIDRARRGVPLEWWLGGAETQYPDFIE